MNMTDIFIEKARKVHGNLYDYSDTIYETQDKKVTIYCPVHGNIQQSPKCHLRGGCRDCAMELIGLNRRSNTETFITKAESIYNGKYDYSKVNYVTCRTDVKIICRKHGDFDQRPDGHLAGKSGCKGCNSERTTKRNLSNTEEFIKKARKIHVDENGEDIYDYSKVKYVDHKTKIKIICRIHEDFDRTPTEHLQGKGCFNCKGRANPEKLTTEKFIEKAKIVHGDKFDYSEAEYVNSRTKITIYCKIHGILHPLPLDHLNGDRCKKCYFESKKYTTEEFVEKAKDVYGDLYDYSKVNYVDSKTKVKIICKIHGKFQRPAAEHLRKRGCQKCSRCPSCLLWKTGGKLCVYCKPKNEKNKMFYKTKEMEVVKFLKEKLPDNDFIHNKSVGSDCTGGHLFPDVLFNCNSYNLIIEIDEFKHRGADYACDEKRMYDIVAKLGMPCIFIRYNPDNKKSDKNVLLTKINEYLNLTETCWDDFGFKAEYLFY